MDNLIPLTLAQLIIDKELLRALRLPTNIVFESWSPKPNQKRFYHAFGNSWCSDFATALEKNSELATRYIEQTTQMQRSKDENSHQIHLKKIIIQRASQSLFIYLATSEKQTIDLANWIELDRVVTIIIVVAANAQAEICYNPSQAQAALFSLEFFMLESSSVRLLLHDTATGSHKVSIASQGDPTYPIICGYIRADIGRSATLHIEHTQHTGTQLYFFDYHLQEKHAYAKHLTTSALHDRMCQAITTRQYHQTASAKSDVLIKTLLDGSARSFYRGTIAIEKNGAETIAHQQHRALMMSQQAYTCGIPSLEVEAHEVQCTHGTAAASIDEQQLWYLQSRGLSRSNAQGLLVESFLMHSGVVSDAVKYVIDAAKERLTQE